MSDEMVRHALKTHLGPFAALWAGTKLHEVRSTADRTFSVGDWLDLMEFNPDGSYFTGRMIVAKVLYLSKPGTFGLPDDLCVMSIDVQQKKERS